jgi:hypothetical protein
MPTEHLNEFTCFNDQIHEVMINPEQKDGGIHLLTDVSDSINQMGRVSEVKLGVGAIAAVTGHVGALKLAAIGRPTSLVDAARVVAARIKPKSKMVIITDGDTNSDKTWQFATPKPDQPNHGAKQELWDSYNEELAKWHDAKREAVLAELERMFDIDVEIHLVGVGEEVKKLIHKACKPGRRFKASHLSGKSTAAQVTTVIRTTLESAPRDKEAEVQAIEIDAPLAKDFEATAEQAAATLNSAGWVTTAGGLAPNEVKAVIEEIEKALDMPVDKAAGRTALLWFFEQICKRGEPLAGGLLGGKTTHVFVDPAYPSQSLWHSYLNKMLTRLKPLVAQHPKVDSVTYDMEGVTFKYTKVNTYSLTEKLSAEVIGVLKADREWCPEECTLTKVGKAGEDKNGGTKRKSLLSPEEEEERYKRERFGPPPPPKKYLSTIGPAADGIAVTVRFDDGTTEDVSPVTAYRWERAAVATFEDQDYLVPGPAEESPREKVVSSTEVGNFVIEVVEVRE